MLEFGHYLPKETAYEDYLDEHGFEPYEISFDDYLRDYNVTPSEEVDDRTYRQTCFDTKQEAIEYAAKLLSSEKREWIACVNIYSVETNKVLDIESLGKWLLIS